MKRTICSLPALIAGFCLILAVRGTAQVLTTLHSFTALPPPSYSTNSDGANPTARLILSGNALFGTANDGGSSGYGTVFRLNTDGAAFTNLHSFTGGGDGGYPSAGLILLGNTLCGTAEVGGSSGKGTVFALNTDGTGFTNLYSFTALVSFTNSDGANPIGGLIQSGNTLFGTAVEGGNSGNGTVFKINTNGTGFSNLHSFTATSGYPNPINSDGANPWAGLILSGNTLYRTTRVGGSSGRGTVFAVNTDGTAFTNLHSFNYTDGATPRAALCLSGTALYGTTSEGGSSGNGTVFKINTGGTFFTNLHSFIYGSDGANPVSELVLSGNMLYGTASGGGSSTVGTVFAINTDGTSFTNLHSLTYGDGAGPSAGVILSGNVLFGTAIGGGSSGRGTVFRLLFAPQLSIVRSGSNAVLSWPSNYLGFDFTGFNLQSAPAVSGPFTNIPGATSPYTNALTAAQQFYRLISN